ncbi:Zinc ion binding,DNA binding, putative isoform 3 [Theobroma cacao]|uniref:Zinc ion binding,DNA binding, putative isoform 3 n=1 Tax=Theobroma cacao TaxID=3641 RepID=A0A061DVY7_THECC|nr:Zinc ion binding,DNA binding, putative isoform 3 [Theobroma cacao]
MGRKNSRRKKEDIAEDYCFFCKDGGLLRVCDYRKCLKSFHPQCVGRDDSLLQTEERWFCGWHFCFICSKPAKFHCFSCPSAVCGRCLCDAEFALVKGKRGFCNTCLELVLLIEDKKDANSNGLKVDFNDRETYEFFFKGYWKLVKEKEGLTSEQVHSSYQLLKDGKNYDFQANNYGEEEASDFKDDGQLTVSEDDDLSDNQVQRRKRKGVKLSLTKRKGKPNKKEFLGWASKQLTEFLTSAGKSVMQELSQHDVATIVTEYCREHKLFDPEKKKKVVCDERLQSLLGRKSVNKNGIYKLLAVHFAENWEQSEDSVGFSSKEDDDNILVPCKRQRKSSPDQKFEEKEIALNPRQGYWAAIVSANIKLVYLKRSLVQELSKQLDTFYGKMMGSFVRVKSDPNDYLQKNSHMLVQVKGIKETSKEGMNSIILLQVSNMVNDVPVCKLSDDDFTEEECEDLCQRMRSRRLERPTVVELEQKARSLHKDITKHWIMRELVLLQNQINRANEKGWRRELSEYTDRMLLLQMPAEQSRLIHEIPEVVADVAEPEPASENSPREDKEEHKTLSESTLRSVSRIQTSILENNGVSCCRNDGMDDAEAKQQPTKAFISDDHLHHSKFIATRVEGDKTERNQHFQQVKQSCPGTSVPQLLPKQFSDGQTNTVYQEKQHSDAAGEKVNQPANIGEVEKQVEVIMLSDDEKDAKVAVSQQPFEDRDWYCISPTGNIKGPYSMTVLKQWSESSCCQLQFKVLKSGQRPEEAVLLTDAIPRIFNS